MISDKLTEHQYNSIIEILKDFKCLLYRYDEVKNDNKLLSMFATRNRNPIYDITNCRFFRTGLISEQATQQKSKKGLVHDHYIQRKYSVILIFNELSKNPQMNTDEFIHLIKTLCSTVLITKDEHKRVTNYSVKLGKMNYELYPDLNIIIKGFENLELPVLD